MDIKKHEEARDRFVLRYKPRLNHLVYNFAGGLSRLDEKDRQAGCCEFTIVAFCQFLSSAEIGNFTKTEIKKILPKTYEFDGVKYQIRVEITGIPRLG